MSGRQSGRSKCREKAGSAFRVICDMSRSSNINSNSRRSFIRQQKQEKLLERLRMKFAEKSDAAWKERLRWLRSVAKQISPYPPDIYIGIDTALKRIAAWIDSLKDVRHRRDA